MMENDKMLSLEDLIEIHPDNLWIDLSAKEREMAWHQTVINNYKDVATSHRAFVNLLCLNSFIKWLENEPDLNNHLQIPPPSVDLWEFVNGAELNFNQARLVLIPSEQLKTNEFRIPQEWVDIPNWAAHYYLAIQLNIEENWLRIGGFISYDKIREKAEYDYIDRTYCVNNRDLIADIDIMWVAQELCPLKKPQVPPLPILSVPQAQTIIEKLSKATVYSPRLDTSFAEWAAILTSDEYRQILCNRRRENLQVDFMENTQKIVHNLSGWFENIFNEGWQSVDDLFNLTDNTRAFQFRSDSVLNEVCVKGAKLIDLGMQLESKSMALLIGLSPQIDNKVGIRVQLYPGTGENYLPSSVKLTLLSESGTTLQSVESRNYDNYIQLKRFKLPLGKYFSIQVALKDVKIKENFVLEGFACSEI